VENRPVPLPAANPSPLTGGGNNTWLLDGEEPTLIDAGVGAPAHIDAIARALDGRPLARVLVTHGHADHASGAPVLRGLWPRAELCKFIVAAPTSGASIAPADNAADWRALADGQQIRAGHDTLTIIHTPGHALDHVCFWNAATGDLFAGDMLVQGTTVMIPAGRGGGLRAYLASLGRLAALSPARIYPGHGPVIERPAELITQYLEHRRMREAQVRGCLAAGLATHARIEDDLLFVALEGPLGPNGGPLAVMREEHAEVEGTLERLTRVDDVQEADALASHLASVAREHFAKEEQVLFPMAEQLLGEQVLRDLGEQWAAQRRGA